jgi:hypothetical protein
MRNRLLNAIAPLLFMLLTCLTGCGGTWIDDPGNFKRVFGFNQPGDVKVVHSYYWKSPHWTTEYRYFIALQASPEFISGLTAHGEMIAVQADSKLLDSCSGTHPEWFLPKPMGSYEAWLPNAQVGYRVFRDRSDGILFLCDERL